MATCSICFDDCSVNPVFTPCIHMFCNKCMRKWLDTKKDSRKIPCPVCNFDISELVDDLHIPSDAPLMEEVSDDELIPPPIGFIYMDGGLHRINETDPNFRASHGIPDISVSIALRDAWERISNANFPSFSADHDGEEINRIPDISVVSTAARAELEQLRNNEPFSTFSAARGGDELNIGHFYDSMRSNARDDRDAQNNSDEPARPNNPLFDLDEPASDAQDTQDAQNRNTEYVDRVLYLNDTEARLNAREAFLNAIENRLNAREALLNDRESELNHRETEIKDHERQMLYLHMQAVHANRKESAAVRRVNEVLSSLPNNTNLSLPRTELKINTDVTYLDDSAAATPIELIDDNSPPLLIPATSIRHSRITSSANTDTQLNKMANAVSRSAPS